MKANRKFVMADEAVSPVIAVILMVAITVVSAATVVVLVSDIGSETGESSPSFNLNADQSNARLKVESAVENADWNRLQFKSNLAIVFNKDKAATTSTTDGSVNVIAGDWTEAASSADVMVVGEYIDFCGGTQGTPAAQADVIIEMRDGEANTAKGEWTFPTVAKCAAT